MLAEGRHVDLQRSPHQRFGLREPVGVLQQGRQIVQANCHVRVMLAESGHVDLQSTPHQRLRLSESAGALQQLTQLVRRPCDKVGIGECRRLGKRLALLLLALLPAGEIHQNRRNSQALRDPILGIAHAFQGISQKSQSGLGERAQRQSFPHLREPVGELLELAAAVQLPALDHLLDF